MKFIQTHGEVSDCTALYDIEDYHEIIADFIGDVLSRKSEWGYIKIDLFCYEYRYGELLDIIPLTNLCKRIKSVKASGGWTRMDYYIKTT